MKALTRVNAFIHHSSFRIHRSIRTLVPIGMASKSSLMSALASAAQPHVQSLSVPPPCMKISPPSAVSHGGHRLFLIALTIASRSARVMSLSRRPRSASSMFG
jgi:hypothetical protein